MRTHKAQDILPGSRWVAKRTGVLVRVMVTAEGYVMARIPGRMVWVMHHRDFRLKYEPFISQASPPGTS